MTRLGRPGASLPHGRLSPHAALLADCDCNRRLGSGSEQDVLAAAIAGSVRPIATLGFVRPAQYCGRLQLRSEPNLHQTSARGVRISGRDSGTAGTADSSGGMARSRRAASDRSLGRMSADTPWFDSEIPPLAALHTAQYSHTPTLPHSHTPILKSSFPSAPAARPASPP